MIRATPEFPVYTIAETLAYAAVHAVGLTGAGIVLSDMLARMGPEVARTRVAALVVYGFGLLGMLSASVLYNLTPARAGRLKLAFRHLDHAMILVMIAGSYTAIGLSALPPGLGVPLCVAVWVLAALGIGLRLAWGRIYRRISLGLHLGMGWLVVLVLPPLVMTVSGGVFACLLLGGIVYSLGSLAHTLVRVPFHNAAWHTMVVVAAALHLVVVVRLNS